MIPWGRPKASGVEGHYQYTLRIANVLASAGVLATGALGIMGRAASNYSESLPSPIALLILYMLPLLSGLVAATVVLISRKSDMLPAGSQTEISAFGETLDVAWRWLTSIVLAGYVLLLIFPVQFGFEAGSDASIAASQGFLEGYFYAVSALSVVVLPKRAWVVFLLFISALVVTVPYRLGSTPTSEGVSAVIFETTFNLMVMMGVALVLRQAQNLDLSNRGRTLADERLLEEQVRRVATQRTNEYVHDYVLSVLSVTASYPRSTPELREAASQALRVLRGRIGGPQPQSAGELASVVREAARDVAVEVSAGTSSFALEPEAGRALAAATLEAITNARLHGCEGSSPAPTISVTLTENNGQLCVLITDDGCGFESADPSVEMRFGVERGIRARMGEAGGEAVIQSHRGTGTHVSLTWPTRVESDDQSFSEEARSWWLEGISAALHNGTTAAAAVCIFLAFGVIIQLNAPALSSTLPSWVVLGCSAAATAFVLSRATIWRTQPALANGMVLAVLVVGTYVTLQTIVGTAWPGTAAWSLGLGTFIACALLVRGSWIAAWSWILLLLTVLLLWSLQTGRPVSTALVLAAGQAVTIVFWVVMVAWSTRAVQELVTAEMGRNESDRQMMVQVGTRRRIEDSLHAVSQRAEPILTEIAAGVDFSDQLRREASLLEAELRDDIRGPAFAGTAVGAAARDARLRGVEVILMDDSADVLGAAVPQSFVDDAVRVLEETGGGRVVIRVSNKGFGLSGTIVSPSQHIIFPR